MFVKTGKIPLLGQLYFFLLLATIFTTGISAFNLNSLCIIALLLVVLVNGNPFRTIWRAFLNRTYQAYFLFFLVSLFGLFYSDNILAGWKNVESKTTLIALPFALFVSPFQGRKYYIKIMLAYCLIFLLISLFCLGYAVFRYIDTQDISVLFYHDLVEIIDQNAIIYTIFLTLALLFLLSEPLPAGIIPGINSRWLRYGLVVFFIAFIILLASKLMLVILALILAVYAAKKFLVRKSKVLLASMMTVGLLLIGLIVFTNNPIKKRYQEIMDDNLSIIYQPSYTRDIAFNGLNLRLIIWRFGYEILNEQNAWYFGVGPGDSQDLLNRKYVAMNMYTGSGITDRGFLDYDFHNQFIEQWMQSGIPGLLILLIVFFLLLRTSIKIRRTDALIFTLILIAVCCTESLLELQHGLFLFCFYPFIMVHSKTP